MKTTQFPILLNRAWRPLAIAIVIAAAAYAVFVPWKSPESTLDQPGLITSREAITGFARVEGPVVLNFPEDQGSHPDYQTEWWYYTGNLTSANGERFGYQLTFFRRALMPPSGIAKRASDWATEQVYLGHFALTNISQNSFTFEERFSRGAGGLAGAQGDPYTVWLNDWRVEQTGDDTYRVTAAQAKAQISLNLRGFKPYVLQGKQGYSQKGPEPGNASMYFSQTRLISQGTVTVGNRVFEVAGLSWMDHEFSTSALAPGQIGWDWFALQLDDGSELVLFYLRRDDGSVDSFSSGTLIAQDGSARHLQREDFEIEVHDTWTSPHSGAVYPAGWAIKVPSANLELTIRPSIVDQELQASFTYWEGAVTLQGENGGRHVEGVGYIELTGYAASMAGQF